ncbi:transglycosylase SLT domain-containing protein [Streptomyces sp. TX20-6-3]|uniref:transglycosylase SLT domain-containing protein n=1 Tax=Streptomyces sp. TX20-6-3 TaxID=3028705 RepID=UPI0029A2C6C3|nr:transglycosylase SLT domain-containing protein [Streptomyces sp. TX20-6-3]MDX2565365.1 transglycosylase SLT domain-containing protein [Streptomyces sp. TX20-6-3]
MKLYLPRSFRSNALSSRLVAVVSAVAIASSGVAFSTGKAEASEKSRQVDAWIMGALVVMREKDIPGSYLGIHRNLMRESSGNRYAINLWDSNARAGIPSKGLMQVIEPTFNQYHVQGTSWNIFDPIANIAAACNYAAHRYGSIDNVNGPY